MNKDFGLVLEGGGFRGSYTAGALKWLNDNGIHFDYTVTISAASCYGFNYMAQLDEVNHNISVNGVTDKHIFGAGPLLKEGTILSFKYLIDNYFIQTADQAIETMSSRDCRMDVGVFNLNTEQLEYHDPHLEDKGIQYIQASCSLPGISKPVEINGNRYLDGGISHMVSIHRSMETGHKKHLVIITKDKEYVRTPPSALQMFFLRRIYRKYPKLLEKLDQRVEIYNDEMKTVASLEKEGKAILIRPSRNTGVGRFSGTKQQIEEMYWLGYQDMEDRNEEILKFLEV